MLARVTKTASPLVHEPQVDEAGNDVFVGRAFLAVREVHQIPATPEDKEKHDRSAGDLVLGPLERVRSEG